MNKNYIFIGVMVAAVVVAAIANRFSSEEVFHDDEYNYSDTRGSGKSSVEFDGKQYECDAESKSVVLEHEDGSTTTVICD